MMAEFDRDFSLDELLAGVARERLDAALRGLLGPAARLAGPAGPVEAGMRRLPLVVGVDEVGQLVAPEDRAEAAAAAAGLLEMLLAASLRYRMAYDLHEAAVAADYEELQRRHAALTESEARYRALSETLQQRVTEQVGLIEVQQRQLYQAEKLASVGQLAAGVAHEINNPIGFVRSNLETSRDYVARLRRFVEAARAGGDLAALRQQLDLDFVLDDFAELLGESVAGIDRVARIVADLKGFSNVDRAEEERVDLNDGLEAACNMAASGLPPGVRLVRDFQPLPRLLCLPGHLNQALLNVLRNAVQAVGEQGEVRVSSTSAGGEIVVSVADDGPGIAGDMLPRVFEPFFTTRPVGSGTGLGLTVARDIVRAHGGRIEIASRVGAGTTVKLILPV